MTIEEIDVLISEICGIAQMIGCDQVMNGISGNHKETDFSKQNQKREEILEAIKQYKEQE